MKIEQKCGGEKKAMTIQEVPVGTVFIYGTGLSLYLRVIGGAVSLSENHFYETSTFTPLSGYKEYPNAKLCLEG